MTSEKKTPADSHSYIAEIVGDESQLGQRMVAGKLLHMMDFAAADAAAKHSQSTLVTLAFDRVALIDYIYHRDYVRYEACVISVGRSSMVVKVDAYTKAPTEMDIKKGHSGFITIVAVDENGHPNRQIPSMYYESEDDLEMKRIAENRECLIAKQKDEMEAIERMEMVEDRLLKDYYPRKTCLPPSETGLRIRKGFLPRNANSLGIVFGGDTIELMEELALATARQFTGNLRMVTIAMEEVFFFKPLYVNDMVEMTSRVVFVANTTLIVEIGVRAVNFRGTGRNEITNKGIFTVLNYDRSGQKKSIVSGLDLSSETTGIRKSYLKEQIKYENLRGINPTFADKCGLQ